MARPTYTPKEYQSYLKTSSFKHLLVEGKNDKQLFNFLIDEFNQIKINQNMPTSKVLIDTAEQLIKFEDTPGNRAKVEFICQMIENTPLAGKLVGFVDREFREFEYDPVFRDNRLENVVQGRLVCYRGHSIENYFFDLSILRDPLRDISNFDLFYNAFEKFKSVMDATIRLACAASLAGKECGQIEVISNRIQWTFITINKQDENMSGDIIFDFEKWKNYLIKKGVSLDKANSLCNSYKSWNQKIKSVDVSVLKWLCHGHIGMAFIRSVYARCVHSAAVDNQLERPDDEVEKTERYNDEHRFKACAACWSRKAIINQCEYPTEVLKLLDF